MKPFFKRLLLLSLVFAGAVVLIRAEDLSAVRTRMEQRLSKIDDLKSQGIIGENNRGFVEVRGGDAEAAAVVSSENTDRQAAYAGLAKQTGTSAEQVGRARAKQLATASAAGVWIQKEDGSWAKK